MALDEPEAYSRRLDMRKPCRGKGTSGLLTTRSSKVGKMMTTVLSRKAPDGTTMVHPRAVGSLHGGWRGVVQEPRSMAVPKVEKIELTWAASNSGGCWSW
jgi:hypothetical protein